MGELALPSGSRETGADVLFVRRLVVAEADLCHRIRITKHVGEHGTYVTVYAVNYVPRR
jgi:hypothetical protein